MLKLINENVQLNELVHYTLPPAWNN